VGNSNYFGATFAEVDVRGGPVQEPVSLQGAELRVRRVGDAVPIELEDGYKAGAKRVIEYDFYVGRVSGVEATVPHCIVSDWGQKVGDSRQPYTPVISSGEECTIRLSLAFKDPGQYEVDAFVSTRLWPAHDQSVKLNAQSMRVLVMDKALVKYVRYEPIPDGRLRKFRMEPVTKAIDGVTMTKLAPVWTDRVFPDHGIMRLAWAERPEVWSSPRIMDSGNAV
jgi:hypothetical protein